ncbi:MAG: carboxylate--amine ligase [Myxococcota bacterium]|jgi:hypothetical protein|nr:carboxylate--amine ligase [Myxococcota bacterium]
MNVVIMSPHFPPNHIHYSERLAARGVNVMGIGDAHPLALPEELHRALSEYYYVPDMNDYDAMVRAMGYFTHRHGKIDRIDSQNEYWLEIEARLREDFNIFGQKTWDTARNRSKMGMKEVCAEFDIPCAPALRVESWDELRSFVEEHALPCILKPEIGVGAAATYRVDSFEQLEDLYQELPPGYLCEPFIHGDIVTFDGIVDATGKIIFATTHEYSGGVMEVVNEGRSLFYYSEREIDPPLEQLGRETVAAFGIRERFFHIEFFRRPEGYMLLEVNVRPPGLHTIDMMNYACDVDLYDIWAAMLAGQLGDFHYERKYFVCFVGRRGTVPHRHGHEAVMRELGSLVVHAAPIPGSYANAMGHFGYILRHPELSVLQDATAFLMET